MSSAVSHARPSRRASRGWIVPAVLALAALITVLHGRCLAYGLFLDDYAHYQQLRECGWSLRDLTRACHLELIGGVIELWWMPEVTLRFFRPLAFGLMKLTYTLSGWSPVTMHVASLVWHLANCTLLMLLLRRLGVRRPLAWAVAALFAIHPGHVATVQWIASQTELMVTTLLLAATHCYAEFRRWPGSRLRFGRARRTRVRWPWGIACVALFTAALFCRENAVVFPLVLLATEPLARRRRSGAALALLAACGLAIATYAALRSYYLGGAALPPRPYVVPLTDPDFFRYVLDKACYYLLGEFLLVPCVPIGGLAYFRERPLAFYGLALLIVIALVVLTVRNRHRLAGRLAPACLFGFMLPVLPAFESPHHLYLPGVGWAIFAALLLQVIGGVVGSAPNRAPAPRQPIMWLGVVLTGLLFGVTTHFFGLAFDTAQAVEDQVIEEIATAPRPVADNDTLYVANLPAIAHYAKPAVEHRTGTRGLRVVALTWSPRLLGMATASELTIVDDRTIELRVADDRYFSGPLGLLTAQASGQAAPVTARGPRRCSDFTVSLIDRDENGISALRFAFNESFAQTGVHLFWGSRTRWACQIQP
jgi:hypothetical protein